jgi:hypothetical protein
MNEKEIIMVTGPLESKRFLKGLVLYEMFYVLILVFTVTVKCLGWKVSQLQIMLVYKTFLGSSEVASRNV